MNAHPKKRWLIALLVAGGVGLIGLVACPFRRDRDRSDLWPAAQKSALHNLGLGMAMYRADNDGRWPRTMYTLLATQHMDEIQTEYEGLEMAYAPLPPHAPDAASFATWWPPVWKGDAGYNAAFHDMAVEWIPLSEADAVALARQDRLGRSWLLHQHGPDIVNAVRLHALGNAGAYPASLAVLSEQGYLLPWLLYECRLEGVRYMPPTSDDADHILCSTWPPEGGRVPVLFMDRTVGWAEATAAGAIVNPRTGGSVAVPTEEGGDA